MHQLFRLLDIRYYHDIRSSCHLMTFGRRNVFIFILDIWSLSSTHKMSCPYPLFFFFGWLETWSLPQSSNILNTNECRQWIGRPVPCFLSTYCMRFPAFTLATLLHFRNWFSACNENNTLGLVPPAATCPAPKLGQIRLAFHPLHKVPEIDGTDLL